ncbi:hypothetical protein [Blastococcus xanthinilyticus]|uniref:DNA primase n=1 Tax=Blastococcus xanthinilyticus TaxID=1564164 RepID=A0A5S5D8B4_9ACTN|nr:hypothetical protein [Blastococcus xanthinilyticus]TYP90819.1 hypothetical protein BD833_101538 [Blastococcus xanthinilyticus]
MRTTTRTFAGALLAAGLGLGGCAFGSDEADLDGTGVPEVFQSEEVGGPDRVDGGDEDADGVDPGTGGIDDDDDVVGGSDADDVDQDGAVD